MPGTRRTGREKVPDLPDRMRLGGAQSASLDEISGQPKIRRKLQGHGTMFIKQPIIIIAIILALLGCATVPVVCPVCPPEDVIINTEAGPIYVREGLMVPENYYTQEEWNQLMKDYYDSLVPRQSM